MFRVSHSGGSVCHKNVMMKKSLLVFFCVGSIHLTLAQDDQNFPPPDDPIVIEAYKASNDITIDGRLDESDWQKGTSTSDFFRREPRQGGPIKYETQVKFLYDDKFLYIAAWCMDSV